MTGRVTGKVHFTAVLENNAPGKINEGAGWMKDGWL